MKKNCLGIIIADRDYKRFINQNKILIKDLSKNFKKIYVINVLHLKLRQKRIKILNENFFPNNFEINNFYTSKEFLNFFRDKKFVALQYLAKNPDNFKIFYLIKKAEIKNIMIMNLGNFGNRQTIEWGNLKSFKVSEHFYKKGFYYIFRILTVLKIFPKIDLLFESNTEIIKSLNNGISRKIENFFPFFKITYFRKIIKINSVYFEFLKKKKKIKKKNYIIFVDTPINHPDRIERGDSASKKEIIFYYKKLNKVLSHISFTFKKKIIICLHPNNKKEIKYFKNFQISKKTTMEEIPNCEIAIFSLSSAVLNAVILNKKIINLESSHFGKYLNNFRKKYVDSLKLFSINIDKNINLNKKDCIKKMNYSINHYKNYINSKLCPDGNKPPNSKIIKIIKKKYF